MTLLHQKQYEAVVVIAENDLRKNYKVFADDNVKKLTSYLGSHFVAIFVLHALKAVANLTSLS